MQGIQQTDTWETAATDVRRDVKSLASHAFSLVAARQDGERKAHRADGVEALLVACVAADPEVLRETVARLQRQKIGPAQLIDTYIPDCARILGARWEDDTMSFAEVTIGMARLQSLARDAGRTWSADRSVPNATGRVLVVVPRGEDHTLGAVVLTARLRRSGISVCLRLHPEPGEIEVLVGAHSFDGAFVSFAHAERLEFPARMVETLRRAGLREVPIVVGGAVLDARNDVRDVTNADLATNDLGMALRAMHLEPQTAAKRMES